MPAFNEEANLVAAVGGVCAVLERLGWPYEIVVVDDGSTDGTAGVCRDLQSRAPAVRVVSHGTNRGYGAAVRSGLLAARNDLVVLFPADRQFDPEQIPALVAMSSTFDVVIGRRVDRADPGHRIALGTGWSWLVRRLFGLSVRDVNSGFKVYRRRAIEAEALQSNSALIDAEILVRLSSQRCDITEVPVRHLRRVHGEPTGARPSVIARSFWELFALRRELRQLGKRAARADGDTDRRAR